MMRRRKWLTAVLASGALVTSACGGSSGQKVTGSITPQARAALQAAATKTAAADSAKVAITYGIKTSGFSSDSGPTNVTINGSGVVGFTSRSADVTLDLSGIPPEPSTSEPVPSKIHVIVVDGVAYVEIPPEYAAKAPAGAHWARLSAADSEKVFGLGGTAGGLPGFTDLSDPTKALAALQALGDTKAVGTEKVRGAETTHYVTHVSLGKAFSEAASPSTSIPVPNPFSDAIAKMTVPLDAWVDGDGLLRKVEIKADLGTLFGSLFGAFAGAFGASTSSSSTPPEFLLTFSLELYDYGTPVHVTAPPPGEVVEASRIAGLGTSTS